MPGSAVATCSGTSVVWKLGRSGSVKRVRPHHRCCRPGWTHPPLLGMLPSVRVGEGAHDAMPACVRTHGAWMLGNARQTAESNLQHPHAVWDDRLSITTSAAHDVSLISFILLVQGSDGGGACIPVALPPQLAGKIFAGESYLKPWAHASQARLWLT